MDKQRDDFVWVRPIIGIGSVSHVSGRLRVHCTADIPAEVTRAEWECRFCKLGVLELCEAPPKEEVTNA